MSRYLKRMLAMAAVAAPMLFLLTGCGDGDGSSAATATYRIELINLTANQPLAPAAVILHGPAYSAWQTGSAAGSGLEQLAESGDPGELLLEAGAARSTQDTAAGAGVIPPGASATVEVTGGIRNIRLTLASMLVNTNDAFAGIDSADLSHLPVGEPQSWDLTTFDSGTEANSETAATVPGPVAGGEGYNPLRDDRDFVAVHPGVVTADDGLAASALDESHRFLNPSARLVVTRLD